jgi:hypothetical protein
MTSGPNRNRRGAPRSPRRTWAEKDGATRISCSWLSPTNAGAAFLKESRTKFADANNLDRKSRGEPHHCFIGQEIP